MGGWYFVLSYSWFRLICTFVVVHLKHCWTAFQWFLFNWFNWNELDGGDQNYWGQHFTDSYELKSEGPKEWQSHKSSEHQHFWHYFGHFECRPSNRSKALILWVMYDNWLRMDFRNEQRMGRPKFWRDHGFFCKQYLLFIVGDRGATIFLQAPSVYIQTAWCTYIF